ncbi:MAG TPA: cupin domain-containing protein [Steroidobacteraceae bacterium]|nr:cupin domain-containing protein [Steroidobacteraceae bacterium]
MNNIARLACAAFIGMAAVIAGEAPAVKVIHPETSTWSTPPNIPDLRSAWLLGAESETGPYAMRVKLKSGGRVPVHTHPDTRYSTVLSGTLYVGFGNTVNEAQMVKVPAGAVYVAPANVPHYLWAKEGEVEYQEAGVGPTGTRIATNGTP